MYDLIPEMNLVVAGQNYLEQFLLEEGSEFNAFPLSYAQQRLWLLDQLQPGSPLYNMPAALRLVGAFDLAALRWSLNEIIRRHEVLRTTFIAMDGHPIQIIAPELTLTVELDDLRAYAAPERPAEIQRRAAIEAQRPFDLANGPLLRAGVLRLADQEHVLLLTLHHIIADGWSLGVLVLELVALYTAYVLDRQSPLPELPIQYADFAAWQREWLDQRKQADLLAYWRERLRGALPVLELPTDRPRPVVQTFAGAQQPLALSRSLADALARLSAQEHSTLFMTLLAAFNILLYRYTGQIDILVGSPVAGRDQGEIEQLIGCFVNTLVLRTELSPTGSFRDSLRRVREVVLGAYAHRDLPFEKLVEDLQPARHQSHSPLFQVMFVLQNAPMPPLALPNLAIERLAVDSGTAKFDLTLNLEESSAGLHGWIEYNTDLFDATTIQRMAGHFQMLLEGIVVDADQPISMLPILTAVEQEHILIRWNEHRVAYPRARCIHQLFEAQVERTPQAIALSYAGATLTYRELDRRANQLAHYLRGRGIGPEVRVGVCIDRSPDLVVGLLGILKAGGAYVPLDPAYPADRLTYMLEDSRASVLITATTTLSDKVTRRQGDKVTRSVKDITLSPLHRVTASGPEVVDLERDWPTIARQPATNPESGATPDNLAYMIYTSGSTGRPKGVMIEHASAAVLIHWARDTFQAEALAGVLASTSICFDLSIFELFVPLSWGGTVILAENVLQLPDLPEAQQVTLINTVPSAMTELVRRQGIPASVQVVNLAGEPLTNQLAQQLYQQETIRAVFNLYGPSEDTTYSTYALVRKGADVAPPIGRPIAATAIYLLDRALQPVPVGVAGEVYIGGAGLARGYLNRPDLTAERFVPRPWSVVRCPLSGATDNGQLITDNRLYKTGDLARYLPDGTLVFLGRIDHQVKIRGFRIEPGEIEAALQQHPGVREAVVLAREDMVRDRRLVAYIVPSQEPRTKNQEPGDSTEDSQFSVLGSIELRAFLKQRLPDYMVPAAFVQLDALPLTPNGKLDRRALPDPSSERPELEGVFVAPRTPVEEVTAHIWAEVLGLERVGVYDNFFELGGHSLLATRLIARLRQALQVELPLPTLFQAPTVAALSEQIEAARQAGLRPDLPPIVPIPREGYISSGPASGSGEAPAQGLPLSFAQQRMWFIQELEPDTVAYTMPIAVELSGPLDIKALQQSINMIVQRHEALRTVFVPIDGRPVQIAAPALEVPLAVFDLLEVPVAEREQQLQHKLEAAARQPFDLARGPLLRASVFRSSPTRHVLLLVLHHIVADGWSLGVLVRELAAIYPAIVLGRPAALAPLPIQYADYAAWQHAWLQGGVLEAQLDYWKARLAGSPPLLELPTDRPRPSVPTLRGAYCHFALPLDLVVALKQLSRQASVTLFMTLLAAWQVLLARYSGQNEILVGTPIAGRTRAELEDLIGCFVNTLVLRTDLAGSPSFRALLGQVREHTLGAYAHQDVPFELIVDALQPGRTLSYSPLFQVLFVLQNTPLPALDLADLALQPLAIDPGMAKFDLTLDLTETAEGLRGWIEYSTDLFDAPTIARMAGHFQTLLEGVTNDSDCQVSTLPLLTVAERRQLLVEWNDTCLPYPHQASMPSLINRQAARTPNTVAVIGAQEQVSYQALVARANQLAHLLRQHGVGRDVPVGIFLPRTPDLIVALLAVLTAGGAYVPLDPAYPAERLAHMLQDAQAPLVLTDSRLCAQLPLCDARPLCLDDLAPTLACQPSTPPPVTIAAEQLAYVIYTSGSTGRPKGVALAHQSAIALINWALHVFSPAELAGVLASTSICFDLSIFELFVPLSSGGTVILADTVLQLAELAAAEQVTLVNTVPSGMRELLRLAGLPPGVQTVNLAGEPLPLSLVRQLYRQPQVRRVYNLYGPTEDTTYSTFTLVPREGDAAPLIGRPIANTQVYVLDQRLQPVPIGVVGEVYLGGAGLARGYLRRPELTAERFIPNPFADQRLEIGDWRLSDTESSISNPSTTLRAGLQSLISMGTRLYKTGDRARFLANGELEYLGRLDHQVKVRGFRIELGEIETLLAQHAAVAEALVLVREDVPGDPRLVAYVVPDQEPRTKNQEPGDSEEGSRSGTPWVVLGSGELRDFLKEKLPEYMLPSSLVVMEAFPLSPNGKIDRKALPAPQAARPELDAAYVAPRTELERTIGAIWQEVLGLNQAGIYSNFFALGGHSLLATQVIARVRKAFEVELPLRAMFETPTIAGLAAAIEAAGRAQPEAPVPSLLPAARDRELPLSFAQQRLWFIEQIGFERSSYVIPAAVWMEGQLDVAALQASLNALMERHEALRTTFAVVDGRPVQVVTAAPALPLPRIDLRDLPAADRMPAVQRRATEAAQQPFDLARGPLLRAQLLCLADDQHVLLLTMHHIVADGWSLGVLVRDLAAYYRAAQSGQVAALPELPVQYADFALWQRAWLQGEVLATQLDYWRGRLAGSPPLLDLPTDRPRPPVQTFRGAQQPLTLARPVAEALADFSRSAGTTLFMTLLAAFQALLHRYTGQADIVVGSPIANRSRHEVEGLIGCFVNTLALRADLSGDPSSRELLQRMREATLGAYAHQDLPFELLVDALQPERNMSYTPLFQVMFVLQNAPLPALDLPGLQLRLVDVDRQMTAFDLTLNLQDMPEGPRGWIEYSTDLFDAATIARMAGHFQVLLAGVANDPDCRVSALPLLTEAERHQLTAWNDTAVSYSGAPCIHQLIEAQIARTPDAIALVFEDAHLTYRELNRRANQLAHYLRRLGVGPNVLVGICLERSLDMVIGLLGILKAGGAYVPLDPAYPPDRLAYMLEDARPAVLLTHQEIRDWRLEISGPDQSLISNLQSPTIISLDADWPTIAQYSTENLELSVTADSLAYMIYTSGSTGRPKGALNGHCGIRNRLLWMQEEYRLTGADRVLQKTPFSFDVSVWEFFWPLLAGTTLVVARPEGHKDSAYLVDLITREQVTTLHFVPPMLQVFLEDPGAPGCTSLRRVICSGEALPYELQQRCFARLGQAELHNLYGPTEAAIDVTYWACRADSERHLVPIGRPVANTQMYVLNRHLQPMPVGVPGELYIGGVQVGYGYLNRPDLTAERFIPNPFAENKEQRTKNQEPIETLSPAHPLTRSPAHDERLYRTGDLARYLPDGAIEYLGRLDHQVKVRGFRIELGEIEMLLAQHEAVAEALVLVREDVSPASGYPDRRLIAYVVPSQELRTKNQEPGDSTEGSQSGTLWVVLGSIELRAFLKQKLPEYMIPVAFVVMEAFPLSPNGKIDRKALPAPQAARPELDAAYVAPRTELERTIAAIWQEVLQIKKIGMRDNFFDLGGHSLLMVQAHARLCESIQRPVTMLELFKYPTISALANYLSQAASDQPAVQDTDQQLQKINEGKSRLKQRRERR